MRKIISIFSVGVLVPFILAGFIGASIWAGVVVGRDYALKFWDWLDGMTEDDAVEKAAKIRESKSTVDVTNLFNAGA